MKKILIILVLVAIIIFGYFAYKSLRSSTGGNLSANGLKSMIENKANEVNGQINESTDQAVQNVKIQASDAIKNKVDQTLGTQK